MFGPLDDPDRPVPWALLPTDAAVRALWSVLDLAHRPAPAAGSRELRVDLALPGLDEPIAAAWAVDATGLCASRSQGA